MIKQFEKLNNLFLIPLFAFFFLVSSTVSASASSEALAWSVYLDSSQYLLIGAVTEDSDGFWGSPLQKTTVGSDSDCDYFIFNDGFYYGTSMGGVSASAGTDSCSVKSGSKDYLAWTWPSNYSNGYTSEDYSLVSFANSTLVSSLNSAVSLIKAESGENFTSALEYFKFIGALSDCVYGSQGTCTSTIGGKSISFTVSGITADDLGSSYSISNGNVNGVSGWSISDFVKITVGNSEAIFAYQVPKGYASGQAYYDEDYSGPSMVGWSHIVFQSSYSYLVQGISSANTDDIYGNSSVFSGIEEWIDGIVNTGLSLIGLASIESLTLNRETRAYTYYKGLMPNSWFSGVSLIYWLFQIIGIFVIAYGFIKTMIDKNLSVINPGKRVELMERMYSLVFVIIMSVLFIPIFVLLATLNEVFVSTMDGLVPAGSSLSISLGGVSLVGIIVTIMMAIMLFKFNITYIIRAVTIAILYATAPLFISLYSTGESGKESFKVWARELCVNIFMQSFHAIITAMYLSVLQFSTLSIIEKFAMMTAYIGMSDYFKNTLMNASSGADKVAANSAASLATMAGTTLSGVLTPSKSFGAKGTGAGKEVSSSAQSKLGVGEKGSATEYMDKNQADTFNNNGKLPARGVVGKARELGSSIATGVSNKTPNFVKKGLKHAEQPAKVAGSLMKAQAAAGAVLGMEAVGANSMEARRALSGSIVGAKEQGGYLFSDDWHEEVEQYKKDIDDGNTGYNNSRHNEKALGYTASDRSAKSMEKLKGQLDRDECKYSFEGDSIDSFMDSNIKTLDCHVLPNSELHSLLSNEDTRANAEAGIRKSLAVNAAKDGKEPPKVAFGVDKNTGERTIMVGHQKDNTSGVDDKPMATKPKGCDYILGSNQYINDLGRYAAQGVQSEASKKFPN